MLDGPLVFVDIDTQRDFLDPYGALSMDGSATIRPNLGRLTRHARTARIPILATSCAHTRDDDELKVFPPHCMAGTPGQARIAETAWTPEEDVVVGVDGPFDPPEELPAHLTLEKREISVFSNPKAAGIIDRFNRERPTFVVYGVATDYCVGAAITGLLDRGCKVAVVADAVLAIERTSGETLLKKLVDRGAVLTRTDDVCKS
jgi:nicotinamidase/pyrazinamidase